jgi:hypothetical protein
MSLFSMTGLTCAGSFAHVLYLEGMGIFRTIVSTSATQVGSSAGTATTTVTSVPLDNPTTVIILIALLFHVIGTLVLIVGLIWTRDEALCPMFKKHPIICVILCILMLVEYKLVWLFSCFLFGF